MDTSGQTGFRLDDFRSEHMATDRSDLRDMVNNVHLDLGYILLTVLVGQLANTAAHNNCGPPKWLPDDGWVKYNGLIDGRFTGEALAEAAATYFARHGAPRP